MELPKIRNEDLPPEIKKILGDADAEFDLMVNPLDIIDINFDPDKFNKERLKTAQDLIESRKQLQEYNKQLRKNENKRHNQRGKEDTEGSKETP